MPVIACDHKVVVRKQFTQLLTQSRFLFGLTSLRIKKIDFKQLLQQVIFDEPALNNGWTVLLI